MEIAWISHNSLVMQRTRKFLSNKYIFIFLTELLPFDSTFVNGKSLCRGGGLVLIKYFNC